MKKIKEMSKMRKLLVSPKKLFLLILGIGLSISSFAQKTERIDDLSYTVRTIDKVGVDDNIELKDIPDIYKTEIVSSEITKSYKKYFDSKNNPQTEITIVSSIDYFPEWADKPKKFILNQNGTSCDFEDKRNNYTFPLDENELNNYNLERDDLQFKGLGLNLEFTLPTEDEINYARNNKSKVMVSKEKITFDDGNVNIEINKIDKTVVKMSFDRDGNERKEIFIYGNKIGERDFLSEKIDFSGFELGSNICASKISHQIYSNYSSTSINVNDEGVEINPNKQFVNIEVPSKMGGKEIKVEVLNKNNEVVRESSTLKSRVSFSPSSIFKTEGFYKVRLTANGQSKERILYFYN